MVNIFISHPSPYNSKQEEFLRILSVNLNSHGLNPINLGKNNWSNKAPLAPIKVLMNTCKAALIVGLERSHSFIGYEKEGSKSCIEYIHRFQSSPWIQIEAGMAYQAGLPLLILKEKKLHSEGILDSKVSEYFVFEFEIKKAIKELPTDLIEIIESWVKEFI